MSLRRLPRYVAIIANPVAKATNCTNGSIQPMFFLPA